MVDRTSDRPVYRQIADVLRTKILDGNLPPGARLPTEGELTQRYKVDRTTVRKALDVLRSEGRIVTHQGRGAFVRERTVLRRLTSDLLTRSDRRGWYAAVDGSGLRPAVSTTIGRLPIPRSMASWLGVEPGTEVLARVRLMGIQDEPPIQMATSYIPDSVVERAPQLAEHDTGPGGMLSRLEDAGYQLHFDEIVSARMPLPEEQRTLRLGPGEPVLVVHRITYSQSEEVLDAMERIVAASRCELAYRFGRDG